MLDRVCCLQKSTGQAIMWCGVCDKLFKEMYLRTAWLLEKPAIIKDGVDCMCDILYKNISAWGMCCRSWACLLKQEDRFFMCGLTL